MCGLAPYNPGNWHDLSKTGTGVCEDRHSILPVRAYDCKYIFRGYENVIGDFKNLGIVIHLEKQG